MASASTDGVDLDAFADWAAAAIPSFAAPFAAETIVGGRSNVTVKLTDAHGVDLVLRRPPLHGVLPTAHDMAREHRIIDALGQTSVPAPHALALCTDPDVIGAPFYVMAFVPGIVVHDVQTAITTLDEQTRFAAGESLVDALVELHAVDPDAVGLGDLSQRDDLIRRQLKRWLRQVQVGSTRDLPMIQHVHDRLAARIPEQHESRIVHGDYRLGNVILDAAGTVEAVLDWEICTLGDPLADVGYLAASWAAPDDPLGDASNPTLAPGFPTREQMLDRYAERSGRDLSDITYFIAFSHWRSACILEGVLARHVEATRGEADEIADVLRRRVDASARLAEAYAATV